MINDTLFMNAIKEYMLCKPINEICKSYVINRQTFYRKKEKFKKDYRLDVDLIRKNNKACIEYNIKYIDIS